MSECKAHRKNSFMPFSCENFELPIHATNEVFYKRSWNDHMVMEFYIYTWIYIYIRREPSKKCDKDVHLSYHDTLYTSLATCIRILHQKVLQRLSTWLYLNTLLLWLVFPLLFTAFLREWMHRYFEGRSLYVVIFNSSAFPNTNKRSFPVK